MTLKELVEWFLDNHEHNWEHIPVSLATAVNMAKIISGDTGDFVIFNNGVGHQFIVWSGDAVSAVIDLEVYAYRLTGKDYIIQVPLRVKNNYITWRKL